jgi:hypothetical protein
MHRKAPADGRFLFYLLSRHATAAVVAAALVLMVLLGACSSAAPQIMQVDWRIIASRDGETVQERLSVFVDVSDADGDGEIAYVEVLIPAHGVWWRLTPESDSSGSPWREYTRDGQKWFGSDTLVIAGQPILPRADMTVRVGDLSGREDERVIPIPRTLTIAQPTDFATVTARGITVPEAARRLFVLRNRGGREAAVRELHGLAERETRGAASPAGAVPTERAASPAGDASPDRTAPTDAFLHPWRDVLPAERAWLAEVTEELGASEEASAQPGAGGFYLVAERTPLLWHESGPWRLPAAIAAEVDGQAE